MLAQYCNQLQNRRDYDDLFQYYETEILTYQTPAIRRIITLLEIRPSALLCFEARPQQCHRLRLAQWIQEMTGYRIVNLKK